MGVGLYRVLLSALPLSDCGEGEPCKSTSGLKAKSQIEQLKSVVESLARERAALALYRARV
jgi:hypothetical protein